MIYGSPSRVDEAWEKLESVSSKHKEIQSHQLENQLISLDPNDFSFIEDDLSKLKTHRLLLANCRIEMKDLCKELLHVARVLRRLM
jgi:hypothetical protein